MRTGAETYPRPALERAFALGVPACVNVITDPTVHDGHSGAVTH